jgi:hypothetical protein
MLAFCLDIPFFPVRNNLLKPSVPILCGGGGKPLYTNKLHLFQGAVLCLYNLRKETLLHYLHIFNYSRLKMADLFRKDKIFCLKITKTHITLH